MADNMRSLSQSDCRARISLVYAKELYILILNIQAISVNVLLKALIFARSPLPWAPVFALDYYF